VSDALGLVIAAAVSASPDALEARLQPEPLYNAISIAVPTVDGFRGIGVGYERWMPGRELSISVSAHGRESASGDYTGVTGGVGAELRWYWRSDRKAWLSRQPAGSMAGWFAAARVDVAIAATHDRVSDDWLGTAVELGGTVSLGYRIAPWRGLEITPSFGLGRRREFAPGLPDWSRGTLSLGLTAGWMF